MRQYNSACVADVGLYAGAMTIVSDMSEVKST